MKSPRIKFIREHGCWRCSGLEVVGYGGSVKVAYFSWLNQAAEKMNTSERIAIVGKLWRQA